MVCSAPRPFTMTSHSKQILAQALQVVKAEIQAGNIQLEYEMVRSKREREKECVRESVASLPKIVSSR